MASDGELESSTELAVRVVDVNDHIPTFGREEYVFVINEGLSTPPSGGRFVGIVNAHDGDTNMNAQLVYSFAEGIPYVLIGLLLAFCLATLLSVNKIALHFLNKSKSSITILQRWRCTFHFSQVLIRDDL